MVAEVVDYIVSVWAVLPHTSGQKLEKKEQKKGEN